MPLLTSAQYSLLTSVGSTDDSLFQHLTENYSGTIDDMFATFLREQGLSGSVSDMVGQWDGTFSGGETTAPEVSAIGADGWTSTYSSPGVFDYVNNPEYVVAQSSGFDALGNPTTVTRNILIMDRLRQVHPNQALLTSDQVTLSETVYSTDVVSGVINNSTISAPKPIAIILTPPDENITGDTYSPEIAVAHGHAELGISGSPVAAVVTTISDESSNTVSVTTLVPTTRTFSESGLTACIYKPTIDVTSLKEGDRLTVDFKLRPWLGTEFVVSTDADSYPSPNLCVLRPTYKIGTNYAYVDSQVGNDGTAVVSQTAATAATSPFATINAAAVGIVAANNSDFSRNNASGGVIRLTDAAEHSWGSTNVASGDSTLVIQNDPDNSSPAVLNDKGSNASGEICDKIRFEGLVIKFSGSGNYIGFDTGTNAISATLQFIDCTWDANGQPTPTYAAYIYRVGLLHIENCGGDDFDVLGTFSTTTKMTKIYGSKGGLLPESSVYTAVANEVTDKPLYANREILGLNPKGIGIFLGWNKVSFDGTQPHIEASTVINDRGIAVVGNVLESYGSNTQAIVKINADGNSDTMENVVLLNNTTPGQRWNIGYNENSSVSKRAYIKFNHIDRLNIKSDLFVGGAYDGNWSIRHRADFLANTIVYGSNNGVAYSASDWIGELAGVGEISRVTEGADVVMDYTLDNSNEGNDTGGGNYTPGLLYAGAVIPSNLAPYTHDQLGRAIPNDGTGVSGALQKT